MFGAPVIVVAVFAASVAGSAMPGAAPRTAFFPGQQWNDTQGNRISARGAGFLGPISGTYYWFGQFNETKDLRNNAVRARKWQRQLKPENAIGKASLLARYS
jgi:hypothetical protein